MKSKKYTYSVAFMLFALMLCKVSAFHVYTHQDDPANAVENCSICDVALESQHSDIDIPVNYDSLPILIVHFSSENIFNNETLFVDRLSLSEHYSRPPPTIV